MHARFLSSTFPLLAPALMGLCISLSPTVAQAQDAGLSQPTGAVLDNVNDDDGHVANKIDLHGVDVHQILSRLTLQEKVGQLLFLGFGGREVDDTIITFLHDKKPGAVALFGRNIKTLKQTLKLIRDVRKEDPAGIPMFVSVDQEGGNVVRLRRGATVLPSNMALGAADDVKLARRVGISLGHDLRIMGFNMNLAPVLDVNSNPNNPVIGLRSFGENPQQVADMGAAYIEGLQSEGISAVAKHFPGHGDTDSDSHHEAPTLPHNLERLRRVELPPFVRAAKTGLDGLMTAHIAFPAIAESPTLPATLSHRILHDLLRTEIGYKGLVVTDGLEMGAIVSHYGSGEAAVRAVNAGADMVMVLWFPKKKNEVQRMLLSAVRSGRISKARLDDAVLHVLTIKAHRGLFGRKLLPTPAAMKALRSTKLRRVVDEIAEKAITVVKNDGNVLPLLPRLPRGISRLGSVPRVVIASTEPIFLRDLKRGLPHAVGIRLPAATSNSRALRDAAQIVRRAKNADVVVIGLLKDEHAPLVAAVKKALPHKPVVVVSFGSPYMLKHFPDVNAYVCAFGFRKESERAAAKAILGTLRPSGHLPVTLSKAYPRGRGLSYLAPVQGKPPQSTKVVPALNSPSPPVH